MLGNMSGPTLLVILFIVLLLFGAPKLPGLAKSLGQSMRILKKEVRNDDKSGEAAAGEDAPPQASPAPQQSPAAPQQNPAAPPQASPAPHATEAPDKPKDGNA